MMQFLNSHEFPITTPSPDDDVFAHVTAAANMTVVADPRRSLQDRALFDRSVPAPIKTVLLMNGLPTSSPEHRRLQAKLQITRDLLERVPDIFLVFE